MLMSVSPRMIGGLKTMPVYPEITGKRILVTGVTATSGVDLVAAFSDHGARLIVNYAEDSDETRALNELLTHSAEDLRVYHDALADTGETTRFIQTAAQIHGGLDGVINFVHLGAGEIAADADFDDVEHHVSAKLLSSSVISRIAANRMALTWSHGLVLNVVTMDASLSPADFAIAGVTKAALSAMTTKQAAEYGEQGVRVNAVIPNVLDANAPASSGIVADADIAALATYLVSDRGAKLTGHIFDAENVASHRC